MSHTAYTPSKLMTLQYSSLKYTFNHFTGVDFDNATGKKAIFKIHGDGKGWAENVDGENRNYDYLSASTALIVVE